MGGQHTAMLIWSAAMPVERPAGLLLTPSCLSVQHSTAGPPPVKQMAANNTVTHPERWHPGPGLNHALCYLSVCIGSEIPPLSSHRHPQIRRYTWVKLTGQLSLISQTYASIMQWVWLLKVVLASQADPLGGRWFGVETREQWGSLFALWI